MRQSVFLLFSCLFITTYLSAQPVISSFSPSSGPIGTSVTITGTGFNASPSGNIVFFGAVKAVVTGGGTTSLTVAVPAGATYQPISVTANNLTGYSAKPFIVTFPGGAPITQNLDQTQNSFAPKIDSTTGLLPHGVALSDFDGDGRPDIATSNNFSITGEPSSVSLLRNTATGGNISFAPKQDILTGVMTYAVAAGDLDGDGKPDLVSTSIVDKTISVFKNTSTTGNISFAAKTDYTSGTNPYSIAITDLDLDGKPDIVVANNLSNTISVYKNTSVGGNLSFAAKVDFMTALAPHFVAAGDLDGDGKPDLAVANEFSNSVSVYRNTSVPGTISFASRADLTTGVKPYGVAIGDLDADGKADMAVSNNESTNYSVFRNTSTPGSISFAPKTDFPCSASPYSISIGDLNGDAKPDIVVPGFNFAVCENLSTPGSISFRAPTYLFVSPDLYKVAIGDINGDGKDDLSGAAFTTDKVSLIRNRNNEPTVRSFTPTTAATGATVTITGINFTGTTAVSFGGIPAQSFTVVNNTTITAVAGTGISGDIKVTNQYGSGSMAGFIFAGPPTISSFTPTSASQGDEVVITGTNFTGATSVGFGGVAAQSFTVTSPTTITAMVNGGNSGNVLVTTPYGNATRGGFLFLPKIISFSPLSAATGQTVTLTGTGFTGITSVSFGGVPAQSFTVVSPTSITAVVANGASGNVSITNVNGTVSLAGFTYIPPPVISSFTPSSAGAGTTVIITGNYFTGASSVGFGGVPAQSFTVVSPTSITAVVGNGASGNITVTATGGTVNFPGFTFIEAPVITSFTPTTSGAGGTVTITGSNFTGATAVSFGGVAATSFIVNSANTITATVASGASGNVSVTTSGGIGVKGGFLFTTVPVINSFSPVLGPIGTIVTITGANFSTVPANNIVYFGAVKAVVSASTGNTITVTAPPGASHKPITVTTGNRTCYSTLPFRVTFTGGGAFDANSFAHKMDLACGKSPQSIVSADFDGDGKPDIATANAGSNAITLIKNTSTSGNLSFAAGTDMVAGLQPYFLATADLDGDGKQDLVAFSASMTENHEGSIFRNTSTPGNISFAGRQTFRTNFHPRGIAVVDFTGDGKPELFILNTNTKPFIVTVLENNSTAGSISFIDHNPFYISGAITDNETPISMAMGDLNEDARPDIVIGYAGSFHRNVFTILRNDGNIVFQRIDVQTNLAVSTRHLSVADFDNDGRPDIIGQSTMYRNTGNFTFDPQPVTGIDAVYEIGDLNGDGKADYTKANYADTSVSVLGNISAGSSIVFDAAVDYTTGLTPRDIIAGDLDGDGQPEIVTVNEGDNRVSILKNTFGYTGPRINSFTPAIGVAGTTVTITGTNFTGITGVSFGGVPATSFIINSPTSITAVTATGVSGHLTLTTAGGSISAGWFTQIPPPPTFTSFTPDSAAMGTEVNLTGTNFSEVTEIKFGETVAPLYTINSPTSITVIVPNGSSGDVSVTTLGGSVKLTGFTYIPPNIPVIAAVVPGAGTAGTVVTITGNNFNGATAVTFGGVPATSFTVNSPTSITATIGAGASGPISVTTPVWTSSGSSFIFSTAPRVMSFSPLSGPPGTSVMINGANFSSNPVDNIVSFGAVRATVLMASSTTLTVTVPAGATHEPIRVTTGNLTGYSNRVFNTTFSTTGMLTAGTFSTRIDSAGGTGPASISIADLDSDGKSDLAVSNNQNNVSGDLMIFKNMARLRLISVATGFAVANTGVPLQTVTGDLDGDGKPDLVAGNYNDANALSIFKNTSTSGNISFGAEILLTGAGGNFRPAIHDFDADGKPDIVAIGQSNAAAYRNIAMAGSISFAPRTHFVVPGTPAGIAAADLDADDKPDLVIVNNQGSQGLVSVYKNTSTPGNILFSRVFDSTTAGNSLRSVATGDLDGDGKPDIVVCDMNTGKISIFKNLSTPGTIICASKIEYQVGNGPSCIAIGDVTGDGKPDLAISSFSSNSISVFANTSPAGSISFAAKVDIPAASGQNSISIGDMDNDGLPDIAVANHTANTISIFRNGLGLPTGIPPVTGNSLGIKLYPNPTAGKLFLDSLQLADKWETLDIMSFDGKQKVKTITIANKTRISFHVSNLRPGLYVAILRRKAGTQAIIKFVKL